MGRRPGPEGASVQPGSASFVHSTTASAVAFGRIPGLVKRRFQSFELTLLLAHKEPPDITGPPSAWHGRFALEVPQARGVRPHSDARCDPLTRLPAAALAEQVSANVSVPCVSLWLPEPGVKSPTVRPLAGSVSGALGVGGGGSRVPTALDNGLPTQAPPRRSRSAARAEALERRRARELEVLSQCRLVAGHERARVHRQSQSRVNRLGEGQQTRATVLGPP